jgi:murein L,D-transpeptidase YafK
MLEKIASYIKLNETPMIIYDQVDYITKEEHAKRREAMRDFLESWKSSWESMDLDKYLSFYDPSFSAPHFKNFASWRNHKNRVKKNREFIKVTFSQPFMLIHRDQLIVKTLQKYESNNHVDYGVKTIHAQKVNDKYRIIREEWIPATEKGETIENVQAAQTNPKELPNN